LEAPALFLCRRLGLGSRDPSEIEMHNKTVHKTLHYTIEALGPSTHWPRRGGAVTAPPVTARARPGSRRSPATVSCIRVLPLQLRSPLAQPPRRQARTESAGPTTASGPRVRQRSTGRAPPAARLAAWVCVGPLDRRLGQRSLHALYTPDMHTVDARYTLLIHACKFMSIRCFHSQTCALT
jgi:hypothetical protein